MSIIQSIRDRAAWIIIGAIALALIAFIVQDAFQNRNMFGDQSNTLGVVNGTKISALEFEERYKRAEELYRQRGYQMNDMLRQDIRESLWNEYVDEAIMKDRYEELGIQVTDKELSDILYGQNPPQDLRQQFTDPNTGAYDANAAYQQIQALRKQKNSPQYASFFGQYIPALARSRQKEKYLSLLSTSVYVPKWLVEKTSTDNSLKSTITYVNVPYSTINDSAVKVSDEMIKEYITKHEDEFMQEDETRSMEYVMFDAGPTAADSAAILAQVQAVKQEFAAAEDVEPFLLRSGSESTYMDAFVPKSKLTSQNADSLAALSVGEVAGPYLENGNYVMAKMIAKTTMPDSVKVRHILIKTGDQGNQTLPDSVASKRMDSIVNAIQGGAAFAEMVIKYSDDAGSKGTGGEYEFSSSQYAGISKEFAEVAFFGKPGDKKVVKVENPSYSGYHYIEVLSQQNFEPAFKIAEFTKAIVPSDETQTRVSGMASQFAAESRTKKEFDEQVRKNKYNKLIATDIKPLDANINGLGSSREVVRWLFENEAGQVAETPFQVEDKFVVPVVTKVFEKGLMPVEKARPMVESMLRNQEKGKQIVSKINNVNSVQAAAQATGQQVAQSDSVMFNASFIPNVGQEPKVVGASFNKAYQAKVSPPIVGNGGVFVLKIDNISAVANAAGDIREQQMELIQAQQRAFSDPRMINDVLKKTVKIKDERHKFF
jgi:peptidyl-prolyl cis-trans isomerase D